MRAIRAGSIACRRTSASVAWIGEWLARMEGKNLKPFCRISHSLPSPATSASGFGSSEKAAR